MQVAALVAPKLVLYVPGWQSLHAVEPVDSEYIPFAHCTQTLESVAATDVLIVPAGNNKQNVVPADG